MIRTKIGFNLLQKGAFLLFHGFWGVFEANLNKKLQLCLQNRLWVPRIVLVEFLIHFKQGSSSKTVQEFA